MTTTPTPPTPVVERHRRTPRRRQLLTIEELLDGPQLEWLAPGFVHRGTVSLLTAQENTYKTFLMLDLALSIAHGVDWQGLEVAEGDVVWLAGEGSTALQRRIAAWKEAHPQAVQRHEFRVVGDHTSFMGHDPEDLVTQLTEEGIRPVLVAVDTVSTVIAGADQNATGPMTRVVAEAQRFVDAFGAACILVHHSPKSDARQDEVRGSGALQSGVRSRMTMRRNNRTGAVTLKAAANNDAAAGATLVLRFLEVGESGVLVKVDLTDNSADDDVTTPTVNQRALLEGIAEALHRRGGGRTTKTDLAGDVGKRWQDVSTAAEDLAGDPTSPVAVVGEGRGRRFVCSCADHADHVAAG